VPHSLRALLHVHLHARDAGAQVLVVLGRVGGRAGVGRSRHRRGLRCGAHGKVSCRQYLHYGTGPYATGSRRARGCRGVLENEAVLHGQHAAVSRLRAGGVGHEPSRTVPFAPRPHRPTDACTYSSINMQVARKRTSPARPARAHRAGLRVRTRRNPRLRFWSAHSWCASDGVGSGMGRPSWGSCHQPRRYHVSPATRGSARPTSSEEPSHAVTQRPFACLCLKPLALISLLYYTRAPQLPHATPPTRALLICVSSPSSGVFSPWFKSGTVRDSSKGEVL